MTAADPWEGLLADGEEILWQGAPSPGLSLAWQGPMEPITGLVVIWFAWPWLSSVSSGVKYLWILGAALLALSFYWLVGVHFWRAYQRRQTHYTLTDRNAFIATDILGRKRLERYRINRDTDVVLEEKKLANIWFAEKVVRTQKRSHIRPVGFEKIENGAEVYALFRLAQETPS